MKTNIVKLFLISITFASSAFAELATEKTKFWSTLVPQKLNMTIKNKDANLEEVCQTYSKLASLRNIRPQDLDMYRKMSQKFGVPVYTAEFSIDSDLFEQELTRNVNLAKLNVRSIHNKDLLPLYNAPISHLDLDLKTAADFKFYVSPLSLTSQTRLAGLETLEVSLVDGENGLTLVVQGKDLACDLFSANIGLEFTVPAVAAIDYGVINKMNELYVQLEQVIADHVLNRKTILGKASVFGYAGAQILSKTKAHQFVVQDWLENLSEILFDENMNRSSNWVRSGSKYVIEIPSSLRTQVKIVLRGQQ